MRFSTVATLAALGSMAAAQDTLGALPKCGQDCFAKTQAACPQFDYKCICGNKDLIAELSCCVATNCNDKDTNTIITLASGLCIAAGVEVPTKASCAASAAPSTSSAASSGSSSSTGASTGSSSVSVTAGPSTTGTGENQSANGGSSTGSPGAAGPLATAGTGLGLAMGVAGLLAAL